MTQGEALMDLTGRGHPDLQPALRSVDEPLIESMRCPSGNYPGPVLAHFVRF
jgi:hypothetical protein